MLSRRAFLHALAFTGCSMRFRFAGGRRATFALNHILVSGQSLSIGVMGDPALSTSQPYSNVMFDGGVVNPASLASLVPCVEASVESLASACANLVTALAQANGGDHVALVSAHGIGGADYAVIKKGGSGAAYANGQAQVAAGIALAPSTHAVRAVLIVHGEADGSEGTPNYGDLMIQFQQDYETDCKAQTGQTVAIPLIHSQMSAEDESNIPIEQLRAHVAAPGKVILTGPKYHLPTVDGSHLTNEGYRQLGEEYARVYYRAVVRGEVWEPLRPKTVSRVGAVITVQFYVPTPPLVLDTTLVPAMTSMGFEWSGVETITDVSITASDTVQITLSGTPAPGGHLKYAQRAAEIAGNLRDSDATTSLHGYALHNWACHFDEVVS